MVEEIVQIERRIEESAAITAGAIARSTNDGSVHAHERERESYGQSAARPPRCVASVRLAPHGRVTRARVPAVSRSGRRWRGHRSARRLRRRGVREADEGTGELLASIEMVNDSGKPVTCRWRCHPDNSANCLDRGEAGVDQQHE